jgi:Asp-tRNA(Asn)/Glu-tRNA(Gln) amidotransferase C subunit
MWYQIRREDKGMAETTQLNKKLFLSIAKGFGLDINDPHIEELYAYVQKILPTLKRVEELDLTDMEPVMPLTLSLSPQGRGLRRELSRTLSRTEKLRGKE